MDSTNTGNTQASTSNAQAITVGSTPANRAAFRSTLHRVAESAFLAVLRLIPSRFLFGECRFGEWLTYRLETMGEPSRAFGIDRNTSFPEPGFRIIVMGSAFEFYPKRSSKPAAPRCAA